VVESQFQRAGPQGLVPVGRAFAKAEVPFAKTRSGIALVFEQPGEGEFVRIDQKRGPVTARPPDSSAMRVFAGEQSVS
jgi:hypothetical protein